MTDLQVIGAIFAAVSPLYGSLWFMFYKLGRMEQRIISAVNGQKSAGGDTGEESGEDSSPLL